MPDVRLKVERPMSRSPSRFAARLVWLALLCLTCSDWLRAANPVMPGADPHALVLGNTIWIYPTWTGDQGQRFFAFSSTNFTDWQSHGPVLDFNNVTWV